MPCKIGGCDKKHPIVCPSCIHWKPSQSSKYYSCIKYQMSKDLCFLKGDDGKPPCKTCQYYDPSLTPGQNDVGRPNLTGINWKEEKKKYMREYMREYMRRKRAEK